MHIKYALLFLSFLPLEKPPQAVTFTCSVDIDQHKTCDILACRVYNPLTAGPDYIRFLHFLSLHYQSARVSETQLQVGENSN